MKALPVLLVGLALAFTAVAFVPTSAAWCSYTNTGVVSGAVCSSGYCHYTVLHTVNVNCPPLP